MMDPYLGEATSRDPREALEREFAKLRPLAQEAILRHAYGHPEKNPATLDQIGGRFGITRERVRQIESMTKADLQKAMDDNFPDWRSQFKNALVGTAMVQFSAVADVISPLDAGRAYARIVLAEIGWRQYEGDWWAQKTTDVDAILRSLAPDGPVSQDEWNEVVRTSPLPARFVESAKLPGVGQMTLYRGMLIRERHLRHDSIVVLLKDGPLHVTEIIEQLGESKAYRISNYMARYDSFVALPKGRWALSGTVEEPMYRSALPAVLDILRDYGPQTFDELVRKVTKVHDVTPWRITQCLDDYRIGYMPDGTIWLVENGARKKLEAEPERPETMVSVDHQVGIRMTLTFDHVRGSGFIVNRWLNWRLGLRSTPDSMTFDSADPSIEATIAVTRNGAGAAFSSIKTILDQMGLREGCEIAIVLDTDQKTWSVAHVCTTAECLSGLRSNGR